MGEIDYTLRTVTIADRSRLANLIHFGAYLHQHLDWKPALDWVGQRPFLLLEKNGEILATFACPPELEKVAWIRLFAVSPLINIKQAWDLLWEAASREFYNIAKFQIAAISMKDWFNELLSHSLFNSIDEVIVLEREASQTLPEPSAQKILIRPVSVEDLDIIEAIDHEAFDTIWKNSKESLRLAFEQSSISSVALSGEEIVGYQFSTNSMMGGHLARLAVKKSMQGKGIGKLIVHDLINQFSKQGVRRITVNTQKNNYASLALYHKAGFILTGEAYRVFVRTIE